MLFWQSSKGAYRHGEVLKCAVATLPRRPGKDPTAPPVTTHNFTLQENTMRTLRQFFIAAVLTLMLALTVFAGEMTTGIAPPQPAPAPAQGDISTTANGTIHTGVAGDTTEATAEGVLAGAVVDLVQGVLSLL
jgi:hypothetical protein